MKIEPRTDVLKVRTGVKAGFRMTETGEFRSTETGEFRTLRR